MAKHAGSLAGRILRFGVGAAFTPSERMGWMQMQSVSGPSEIKKLFAVEDRDPLHGQSGSGRKRGVIGGRAPGGWTRAHGVTLASGRHRYAAQQLSLATSRVNVCAASFIPSAIVR